MCQTLQTLALMLAAPQVTAALCPPGAKKLQRAWFQRESSKTRGQPPPPLPPLKGLPLVADGLAAAGERLIVLASALSAAGEGEGEGKGALLLNLRSGEAAEGIVDAAPLLATTRYLAAAQSLLTQLEGTRASLDAAAAAAQVAAAEGGRGKEEEPPAPPDLVAAYREADAGTVAALPAAVDEWAAGQRPVVDMLAAPPAVEGAATARRGDPLARLRPVAALDAAFQWTVGPLSLLAKALATVGADGGGGPSTSAKASPGVSASKRGREGKELAGGVVDPRAKRQRRREEQQQEATAAAAVEVEGGLASPEWGEEEEEEEEEEEDEGMGGVASPVDDLEEDAMDATPVFGGDDDM